MSFPAFEQWCDEVLHPEDTHPWNFRTREFYEEYRAKYAIAKLVQPKSILEIGVRFGYSARSFMMAAPDARYLGIDFDEPSWGPYQGAPREWAEKRLKFLYPNNKIQTLKQDSQVLQSVTDLVEPFDLVHVDADHTYKGALQDMITFWPACKNTMVVDDAMEVRPSIEAFKEKHSGQFVELEVHSLRGSALLVRVR